MRLFKEYRKMICDLMCKCPKEKEIKSFKRYPISNVKLEKLIKYLEDTESEFTEEIKNVIALYKAKRNPYIEKYLNEVIWAIKW